ncbi:ABC transporter permease subunit [Paenibacillus rhizovicinus]|uniref:ABC transporter permease subunit n=1 Tax=Paenibacillus rhizovicinus TaxID=2704463 RepID=A0A6C0P2M3_9BACL|nr:ABC transporter permease subunit [Paenibacillus rhizovicinus]QHW32719.1 ABC transporter permease subunit [Paenibacillus rhizovicinus]
MLVVPGFLLSILLFALAPAVLQADLRDGTLHFHWANGISSIRNYLQGIFSGESFHFLAGRTEHSFWEQIGAYFKVSFFYTVIGGVVGLTGGMFLGVYFAISRYRWMRRILELTSILPDFVIVLLLQFLVVYFASVTGVAVFQVASVSTDDPAIALPLISTILIPSNYMIRNVALQMNNAFAEDYITFARARGLGKSYIVFFHALPNVLPFIKADLHKFMGILFGNLFIFEYLYNLNGVTLFVFSNAFDYSGYQYSFVVNGLFTLSALYFIVYALLRAAIFGWEKVIVR